MACTCRCSTAHGNNKPAEQVYLGMVTATVNMAFHSTLQSQTTPTSTYSLDCKPFGFFLSLFLL